MRYDVKKFVFVGVESEREAFFKQAQEGGFVNFIDTRPVKVKEVSIEIQEMLAAIKILRGLPSVEQEETEEYTIADGLVQKILQLKHTIEKLLEEERILRLEIARVSVFGNFSREDIAYIEKEGKCKVQFFCAKQGFAHQPNLPEEVIYVGSEHNLDHFIAINKEPMQYEKMVEMHVTKTVDELRVKYESVEQELYANEKRLKTYAKYNTFLHHALVNKLNHIDLEVTQDFRQEPIEGELFAIEGWVPVTKIESLHKLVERMHVHVEEIAVEPVETVPTYLENKGMHRVGEDLVHIYDTPSSTDKDPSLWILVFFAFFFSFIVGDAGYGLVLLLVAMYIRFKVKHYTATGRRVLKLCMILAGSIIVWGTLMTSFFGITIAPDSPIRKVSLMQYLVDKKVAFHFTHHDATYDEWVKKYPDVANMTDPHEILKKAVKSDGSYDMLNKFSDNIMMELALFIGVVHLILSMARYLDRQWTGYGWIIFLIGCYLYLPHFLGATSMINFVFNVDTKTTANGGFYLIFGGITIAWILGIVKHKWLGLLEGMTVIQIFGDVLSYLRLYALGLAGAMLTSVINDMASSMNFVFAVAIIIFGHLVNLVLGVMGGVIHGLRLNFLEWYHYSFEGGGKMFKPLYKRIIE